MTAVVVYALLLAIVRASPAAAGPDWIPTRLELERFTCRDLMALPPDQQERALVYLTGFIHGRRGASTFDAPTAGAAIDRLLASCRATPSLIALDTFIAAWADASRAPAGGR
jgi:HdeA/HdeB family